MFHLLFGRGKTTESTRTLAGNRRQQRRALLSLLAMGTVGLALAGCSSSDGIARLPTVPVEGQLTFDGKPLADADVIFHPQNVTDQRHVPSRGKTDANGNYKLTTYDAGDGAPVGNYAITVAYYPLVNDANGVHAGPNVLPPKYSAPQLTELKAQVTDGGAKLPPLTLKR